MGVWNVVSKGPEVGLSLLGTYTLEGDRVVSVLVVNLLLFSLPDLSARHKVARNDPHGRSFLYRGES